MIALSWWEQFIIAAGISFLTLLTSKVTNQTELAALQAALSFLNRLLAGQVSVT